MVTVLMLVTVERLWTVKSVAVTGASVVVVVTSAPMTTVGVGAVTVELVVAKLKTVFVSVVVTVVVETMTELVRVVVVWTSVKSGNSKQVA